MIRLSAQDAAFIHRSAPGTPMNVAGVLAFERRAGGLDVDRVRDLVADRLDRLPMLRARVSHGDSGPHWVDDASFHVERHVGELDVAGDDPGLVDEIARLHTVALPTDRPLWRLDVVPQGRTGGPTLLFRAHHSLADGISSMQVMRGLLDPIGAAGSRDGDARERATPPAGEPPAASRGDVDDAYRVARDVWDSFDEHRRERLSVADYERALVLLDGWLSILGTGRHGLPRLPASGPVRTRISLTEVPSGPLRTLRKRWGARFDAVGLTVVADAVGRLLDARGDLPATTSDGPRIRTLVPVATSFGAGGSRLGNHASFLLLALPIGRMDPRSRLSLVAAEVDEAVRAGQHRAVAMSMRALETAPVEVTERVDEFTAGGDFVDLVVSCVPGARRALTFDGLPHRLTHAVLPITEQARLAVGWSDIAGRSGVAITADRAAVPELEFLTHALERAATSLLDAASASGR